MLRPLLVLVLAAATAAVAAGCGAGVPSTFASCGQSATENLTTTYPRTYDCLAAAYAAGCRPAEATISEFGIDAGTRYHLRLYRRGGRCAGDVEADGWVMQAEHPRKRTACRQAYMLGRRVLTFFQCGDEGDLRLARGTVCRFRIPPRECRALRKEDPKRRCSGLLGTRQWPMGC